MEWYERMRIFTRVSWFVFRILSFPFVILSYIIGAIKFCVSPKYAARSYFLSFSSQTLQNVIPLISADEKEMNYDVLLQDSNGLIKKTYIYLLGAAHEMGEDKNMSQDEIKGMFMEMLMEQYGTGDQSFVVPFVAEVLEESESDEGRYLFLEGRNTVKAMLGEYFNDAPSEIREVLKRSEERRQ